jgi:hypothetical protein
MGYLNGAEHENDAQIDIQPPAAVIALLPAAARAPCQQQSLKTSSIIDIRADSKYELFQLC